MHRWLLLWWLLLTLCFCKTPLRETGCLGNLSFLLTGCLRIQFFDSPQHNHLGQFWLPTPHCAAPVWHAGHHAFQWSPSASHPTEPLPREAEDFPRGERHFKHEPQLIYIIYLPLTKKSILVGSIYVLRPPKSKGSTAMEPPSHWFWTCILKSSMHW